MIRAWQKVRKSFRFIRPGFDQYGYLKADADSFRRKTPMFLNVLEASPFKCVDMLFMVLWISV